MTQDTHPPAAAGSNLPELSVSDLARALKRTVEDAYGYVRVRGEISQPKRHVSGHVYLRLKDEQAVLEAVCWKGTAARLPVQPEDGMEVVCSGRLTTYPGRSQYQLIIETMELAGQGALLKMLEERRRRLAAEGLFAAERKRRLPFLPEVIGVVTSPTGAVIRDILHRLADRFPRHVLLWPVAVQGEQAASQVAAAIAGFNALKPGGRVPRPDLLIVARGGGSLEDLMAFNEEAVVRAAAASAIPLISAVGHETDTTLIDFAADVRAPTPTAAAEMAVPVRAELAAGLRDDGRRLDGALARRIHLAATRLEGLGRGLGDPQALIDGYLQRLDDRAERLVLAASQTVATRRARLTDVAMRLRHPREQVAEARAKLASESRALAGALGRVLIAERGRYERVAVRFDPLVPRLVAERAQRLQAVSGLLASYSYRSVLARGFALVRDAGDRPVLAAADLGPGMAVTLAFHDGEAAAVIGESGGGPGHDPGPSGPPRRPQRPRPGTPDQGRLL